MSVARALTKRAKRSNPAIDRAQISLPVTLISTTNTLAYNAPDIASLDVVALRKASAASSSASLSSSGDSVGTRSSADSTGTVTDASSIDFSPVSPEVEPNHLTSFFKTAQSGTAKSQDTAKSEAVAKTASTVSSPSSNLTSPSPTSRSTPSVPFRSRSNSKLAQDNIPTDRSPQARSPTKGAPNFSSPTDRRRPSIDTLRTKVEPEHPFGKELEQLTEVAEGFGDAVREAALDQDTTYMQEHNLVKFSVGDYLNEIAPLFAGAFDSRPAPSTPTWI